MHVVLWASFFYGLGYLFQNLLKKISVKYYVSFGMLLLAFIVCQFLPKTDMCFNNHGLFPLNTIVAIWSTTAIILISKTVSEHPYGHTKRILIWGGGNTYTIMGLSQIIMIVLKDIFIDFPIPSYANSLLRYILLFTLLYIASLILNKHFPFFIGKRLKKISSNE